MRLTFYILKYLDKTVGLLLSTIISRPPLSAHNPPNSVLLLRPGGIGDAVLLAPAIAALRRKFPQAKIMVLAEKRNAGVFAMIPGIDRILRYDVLREFLVAFRLNPDVAIDTEQWHRLSAVVARQIGAATLIGYGTNERARLFHHATPYSHNDYEADSFFRLLAPLGITPPTSLDTPFLSVPSEARARAAQLLAPLSDRPFIALFAGASISERRWGAKRFRQVTAHLAEQGYGVVVVGGGDDAASGAEIITALTGLNLAGQTSLAETAAIIDRANLLISGDSGVLHLGVGLDTPTISLFGPGIAEKWAPRGPKHLVLNHHLPCSPCTKFGYTQRCPHNVECMKTITSDEVFQAAIKLLQK